jgi:hypothetical protein
MKHSWNEEQQGRGIMADRFDLDAIEADDALLDLLAAGGESARSAGEHDPALALLADLRLAVEVEDELPVETIDDPESFLARCAALNPITDPFARKMATRGLAFGVAAVAALSVSGVAAAVNGDPLSPYEKVIEKMVDAVRPQTSFPKEDLDGLPVVDRSKIVKVGKDFEAKAKSGHLSTDSGDNSDDTPQARQEVSPPMLPPLVEKPVVFPLTDPVKTQEPLADDGKPTTADPTGTKTTAPTDTKTTETPTDTSTASPPPATTTDPPPTTPTDEPTNTTTTPPPTDPATTDPSTPPASTDTGTDSGTSTDPGTGNPSAAPTGDSTGGSTDGSGTGEPAAGATTAPTDGGTATPPAGDTGGTTTPADAGTVIPSVLDDLLKVALDSAAVPNVLPTPTGEQADLTSAQRFLATTGTTGTTAATTTAESARSGKAKGKAASGKKSGKHSSGKVSTGSVRKAYAKGKHSTGDYPEGKHAAIARTHGSTDDSTLLTILGIVNTPTDELK